MLGILLIYWIGKRYYTLAHDYHKSPWAYTILAIAIYYGTQVVFGIILYVAMPESFSEDSNLGINLLGVALGLLMWYLVYEYLSKKWDRAYLESYEENDDSIETIGQDVI